MSDGLELTLRTALIGIGATLMIDLWGMLVQRLFGVRPLNFGMLGRWLGHMPRGQFVHENIATASPVRGELVIGWIAHYTIGVVFAALLLAIKGLAWMRQPTLPPALVFGMITVVFPFFTMQPGMGLGIASAKASRPNLARLRSLGTHTVFGFGLYASALLLSWYV